MAYEIEFAPSVDKEFRRLGQDVQAKLVPVIDALAFAPRPRGVTKLGTVEDYNCCRIRVGDYRIVYVVLDDRLIVLIVRVGHRKEVYDEVLKIAKKTIEGR